jgi:Tfp pilus assembly protein PilE
MRILAIAAIIASLAMPAYAQMDDKEDPKAELSKALAKKKKEAEEIEKAYNETVKKTREQPGAKKTDPWANMR